MAVKGASKAVPCLWDVSQRKSEGFSSGRGQLGLLTVRRLHCFKMRGCYRRVNGQKNPCLVTPV